MDGATLIIISHILSGSGVASCFGFQRWKNSSTENFNLFSFINIHVDMYYQVGIDPLIGELFQTRKRTRLQCLICKNQLSVKPFSIYRSHSSSGNRNWLPYFGLNLTLKATSESRSWNTVPPKNNILLKSYLTTKAREFYI